MVTKSKKAISSSFAKPPDNPLYLKEHRKAKGISATEMAKRLGIERESVYRQEREQQRIDVLKVGEIAKALGVEPSALWKKPAPNVQDAPDSLDAILDASPADLKAMAADIVRRLVNGKP